ncbi:hypothetical protein V9K46_004333 [Vibrio parahaemolyticus]
MKAIDEIKKLFEMGAALDGEVGAFFAQYSSYVLGTVIILFMLYLVPKIPPLKAIHSYAMSESSLDKGETEFMKMFQSPKTRITLNIIALVLVIVLMLSYAFFLFVTVSVPFKVDYSKVEISWFSVSAICIVLAALELWVVHILMRMKEQISKLIRLDREKLA